MLPTQSERQARQSDETEDFSRDAFGTHMSGKNEIDMTSELEIEASGCRGDQGFSLSVQELRSFLPMKANRI